MTNSALLVGINYLGTDYQLNGCANDITRVNTLLRANSFSKICLISDDHPNADFAPSKKNITTQLKKLISNSRPGDTLFFHYSGHGTYARDNIFHKDEADGKDEAICPTTGGNITDDELYEIIKKVPIGVNFYVLMDCCHSGTMLDLANNLDPSQQGRPNNAKHGFTFLLSGCKDDQTSADAFINNNYQGALTACFLDMVNIKGGLNNIFNICFSSITSEMNKFRKTITEWMEKNNYDQRPNIAYEGTLTVASAPNVIYGFKAAESRYPLRQTQKRKEYHSRSENAVHYEPISKAFQRLR